MMISSVYNPLIEDREIWQNLKDAIACTSGFQCWQEEHNLAGNLDEIGLDDQIRGYLRSTLETLAY